MKENKSIIYFLKLLKKDKLFLLGVTGILFLLFIAIYAPFLSNGRPFLVYRDGHLSYPFIYYVFAPDGPEKLVDKFFNYLMLFLPLGAMVYFFARKNMKLRIIIISTVAVILLLPFIMLRDVLDKTNWRGKTLNLKADEFSIFAPVPYGPFENIALPYQRPNKKHLLGTDHIGRDVLSRIIYGSRVSLAVGFFATLISLIIGTSVGLLCGYLGGMTDLVIMRVVEIIICFPTFLLLLIFMAMMMDMKMGQSVIIVIPVIGFLGWTGLARIVRGEVLTQRGLAYVESCEGLGMKKWRIMFIHLLPNVSSPIIVTSIFAIASNVLAESGLSFLGFGVQAPTASWGELLKEAFADPLRYWHLTLWPGLLIFFTVSCFNLTGKGVSRFFDSHTDC